MKTRATRTVPLHQVSPEYAQAIHGHQAELASANRMPRSWWDNEELIQRIEQVPGQKEYRISHVKKGKNEFVLIAVWQFNPETRQWYAKSSVPFNMELATWIIDGLIDAASQQPFPEQAPVEN